MTLTSDIQDADGAATTEIYLINETVDLYRWVGPIESMQDWGVKLARLKGDAVADKWPPIPVEWLPETIDRKIADFASFRPNLRCVSKRAVKSLLPFLASAGEILRLDGLSDLYNAYHCLKEIDAMHRSAVDQALSANKYASFHSPTFVPTLLRDAVFDAPVFRIPESYAKIFVSGQVKATYDADGLTGLDFYPVPLI